MNNQRNQKEKLIPRIRFLDQQLQLANNNCQISASNISFSQRKCQNFLNKDQMQLQEDQSKNQIIPIKNVTSQYRQKSKKKMALFGQTASKMCRPQKKLFHLSKELVNYLYRQNIKNYNPYITALSILQEQANLKQMQAEMIRNLCYIGIAKNYIKSKKYSAAPNYTPVNVLIRTYMRDKMCKQIIDKQENNQNVIYIPINELALSFNPFNFPANLQEVLSKPLYTNIINEVNKIISFQYIEYKKINSYENDESLLGKILLGIIVILGAVFGLRQSKQLLFLIFGLGLIWIAYIVYLGKINLQKMVESRNVTKTIEQRLIRYFETIKTYRMEWKVGQDFYWLEIHYIKKKKKDFKI